MNTDIQSCVARVLAERCETGNIEVKAASGGTPKVFDTLSSFSNQNDGGTILFGIDEAKDYAITGVPDVQKLQKDVVNQCNEMLPTIRPVFETMRVEGKVVVSAYIAGRPVHERPVYRASAGMARGSFVRVGDADIRMTDGELYELEAFKNRYRDDVSVSPLATGDMLDEDAVAAFMVAARDRRPRFAGQGRDKALELLGIEREGRPTLAGLMVLGRYPQQVYPNCCVTAIAVAGTTLEQTDGRGRFLDNKYLEGPIDAMVEDAVAFVMRNTRTRSAVEGVRRVDVPEYPEVAVREIVANALMHRDYGPYSIATPVRLVVYADRVECWNPGGLFGGQEVADLGSVAGLTRNPTLVSLLELTGVAENRHSGICAIRSSVAAAGLPEPQFQSARGSFTATLCGWGDAALGAPVHAPVQVQADVCAWMASEPCTEKTAAEKTAAAHEDARGDLLAYCSIPRSREEIASFLGVQLATASRGHIAPLVERGELRMTMPEKPRSKFQRFYHPDKGESDAHGEKGRR